MLECLNLNARNTCGIFKALSIQTFQSAVPPSSSFIPIDVVAAFQSDEGPNEALFLPGSRIVWHNADKCIDSLVCGQAVKRSCGRVDARIPLKHPNAGDNARSEQNAHIEGDNRDGNSQNIAHEQFPRVKTAFLRTQSGRRRRRTSPPGHKQRREYSDLRLKSTQAAGKVVQSTSEATWRFTNNDFFEEMS
jgi:hypothetical protein